jgi:hypothetical protein
LLRSFKAAPTGDVSADRETAGEQIEDQRSRVFLANSATAAG